MGPPDGPPGQRNKRRPPVIELTATEVEGAAATAAQSAAGADPSAPGPTAQSEATAPDARATEAAGASPDAGAQGPRPGSKLAWLPPGFPWPLAAAGAAGVALTVIVLALTGIFSTRENAVGPLDARLQRLEQQVSDLSARPQPAAADPSAVADLAARIARLETLAATPKPPVADPALANRIATLEGEIRALAERVGVLGRRSDEIGSIAREARTRADAATAAVAELQKAPRPAPPAIPRAELDALGNRIAALEQAARKLEAELGKRPTAAPAGDPALRLLVVANALQNAVERSAPYAAELDAAKAAAANPAALKPLEPFAKTGLPSAETLARELSALMAALAKAVGTAPQDASFIDRLKASAEKIVRVRPLDEVAGDDPAAIVQRIGARAAQSNIAGALAELAKLPAPARAIAKEWIARAQARNAALEASRRFAADALVSAGKPSL
jgi:hypothetical protein